MNWYNVKDKLPVDKPINQQHLPPSPNYDWVPVTDGKSKWAMARYGTKPRGIDNTFVPGWDFFDGDKEGSCAECGDMPSMMNIDEIVFWGDIWKSQECWTDDD